MIGSHSQRREWGRAGSEISVGPGDRHVVWCLEGFSNPGARFVFKELKSRCGGCDGQVAQAYALGLGFGIFILRGQQDCAITCGGARWSWAVAGQPSRGFDSPRSQCLRWCHALLSGRRSQERLIVLANTVSVLSGGLAVLTNLLATGDKVGSLLFCVGGFALLTNLLTTGDKVG